MFYKASLIPLFGISSSEISEPKGRHKNHTQSYKSSASFAVRHAGQKAVTVTHLNRRRPKSCCSTHFLNKQIRACSTANKVQSRCQDDSTRDKQLKTANVSLFSEPLGCPLVYFPTSPWWKHWQQPHLTGVWGGVHLCVTLMRKRWVKAFS